MARRNPSLALLIPEQFRGLPELTPEQLQALTKKLTPEQHDAHVDAFIAAHAAECDGCSVCHGEPPPDSVIRRHVSRAFVAEVFKPGYAGPSEVLRALQAVEVDMAAEFAASQHAAASKRRTTPEREAAIVASFDDYQKEYGRTRSWLSHAKREFNISATTIKAILKRHGRSLKGKKPLAHT